MSCRGNVDGAEVNPPTSGGNGATLAPKTTKDLPEEEPYDAKAGMQRIREMIQTEEELVERNHPIIPMFHRKNLT